MYITHLGEIDPRKIKSVSRPALEIQTMEHLGVAYNTGKNVWLPIQIILDTHIAKDELNKLMMKELGDVFVDIVDTQDEDTVQIKESWILRDARIDAVNLNPPEEMTEVIVTLTYSSAMLLM